MGAMLDRMGMSNCDCEISLNEMGGMPDPNCKNCGGAGFIKTSESTPRIKYQGDKNAHA